jgi:hypothetical protein
MDERFTYLVQKHLDHNLEGAEILEFDKYLENPDCVDYLEKAKEIDKFIDEGMRQMFADPEMVEELLSEPSEFDKQIDEDIARFGGSNISTETREKVRLMHENMLTGRKRTRRIIYGSLAATVITGIIIFFALSFHQTPKKLYAQYYKPYEFIKTRGINEDMLEYRNAVSDYMFGNYSASALMCKEIISSGSQEPKVYFLYGLSLMGLDSMESGIRQFNTVISLPIEKEGSLFVSSTWYESLCYLYMGRADSALVKLEVIRGIDNMFTRREKVEELVEGIEGL